MNPLTTLRDMLTFCRPAGSSTESAFIARYIATLPGAYQCFGSNWIVAVDDAPILWSCHTDTVHRSPGRQTIRELHGVVSLSRQSVIDGRNCLGADDTAGVWLCREMILARVPGTYIFHYAEEKGGIGSSALADHVDGAVWLARFTHAIAFDRRGSTDIITHQAYGRTASDTFALSLAGILLAAGLPGYCPCDTGIFTDTANYAGIIGECSNVSVGYQHEHTVCESLDLAHVARLRVALLAAEWSLLAAERVPSADDENDWYGNDDDLTADLLTIDSPSWRYLDSDPRSCRLDPEYDEIQRQLTIDLLKYRSR